MDIVAFYQDATQNAGEEDAVWKKFGGNKAITSPLESNTTDNSPTLNARPGEGVYEKPVSRTVEGVAVTASVLTFLPSHLESGACSSRCWHWSDSLQYLQEVDSSTSHRRQSAGSSSGIVFIPVASLVE